MTVRILVGDARELVKSLENESIQTVITSPPYWGLRDYGTATWLGGDPDCTHAEKELRRGVNLAQSAASTRGGAKKIAEVGFLPYRSTCGKCGAERRDSQIGLEETPEDWAAALVGLFAEIRPKLKDDGTLWVNVGDAYATDGTRQGNKTGGESLEVRGSKGTVTGYRSVPAGLKSKDLIGLPWLLAFAMRADGWYLRQEIIWEKPNPMPESVRDRPTKSHEQVFLFSKSPRYYYDADAITEPVSESTHLRVSQKVADQVGSVRANGGTRAERPMKAVVRSPKSSGSDQDRVRNNERFAQSVVLPVLRRNKRTVWKVATMPFKGAHFATFPPKLIEPCILAGSRPGDTILDPFGGAGTTALVGDRHGRDVVLCELNAAYAELAKTRLALPRHPEPRRRSSPRPDQHTLNLTGAAPE